MERLVFILKVVGITTLITAFLVSLGIILTQSYGISNAPVILLSAVNAIAVISLAYFTYSYMKATRAMADEVKRSNDMAFELNYRPKVTMRFEPKSNGAIYIVVENSGNGASKNIKFDITPELKNSQDETIEKYPPLKDGINYLAPKENRSFFFDTTFSYLGKKELSRYFEVNIQYDWFIEGMPTINEKCPLDLSSFLHTDLDSYKDDTTLINEVEKIRKALEKGK